MQRDGRFPSMNRRQILHLTGLAVGSMAANARTSAASQPGTATPPIASPGTIPIADFVLNGGPMEVELGSRRVTTWGYNGLLPGPEIRVTEGATLQVTINNGLPAQTTIHWHGQPVPNAMDGVPNVTQPPIEEGQSFIYTFVPPATGTYFYHSHVGIQLDRALSGPLIVEPAREELSYDREFVLMLDDWLDGVSGTPEQTFADLQANGSQMAGMGEIASAATPAAAMQPPEYPPDIVYPST